MIEVASSERTIMAVDPQHVESIRAIRARLVAEHVERFNKLIDAKSISILGRGSSGFILGPDRSNAGGVSIPLKCVKIGVGYKIDAEYESGEAATSWMPVEDQARYFTVIEKVYKPNTTQKRDALAVIEPPPDWAVSNDFWNNYPLGHPGTELRCGLMPVADGDVKHLATILTLPQYSGMVLKLLSAPARAISMLHSRRWLHMDVKPGNLLYYVNDVGDTDVRLCDFGCVRKPQNMAKYYSRGYQFYPGCQQCLPGTVLPRGGKLLDSDASDAASEALIRRFVDDATGLNFARGVCCDWYGFFVVLDTFRACFSNEVLLALDEFGRDCHLFKVIDDEYAQRYLSAIGIEFTAVPASEIRRVSETLVQPSSGRDARVEEEEEDEGEEEEDEEVVEEEEEEEEGEEEEEEEVVEEAWETKKLREADHFLMT